MKLPMDQDRMAGEKIFLRTLDVKDASAEYVAWLNDPVVNQYLETRQATLENIGQYIREKLESPMALFLGIFWKEMGRHIGNIKLEPIDWEKKIATMGILIGDKEYWGKGVATEATNLIVDYAFRELGLKEVRLGVIATNTAARRVYEKCGFTVEKIEPNAIDHDGQKFDHVWMKKQSFRV